MRAKIARFAVAGLIGIAMILSSACASSVVPWHNYPHLWGSSTQQPWLVILCKVNDNSTEPAGLSEEANRFFTVFGGGEGNMADYFSDVSYGAISLVDTKVIGWYTAPFSTADLSTGGRLAGPGNRYERVKECANAVPDSDADFSDYWGVIMITNIVNDGGACAIGKTGMTIHGSNYNLGCVVFDPNSLYTAFAAHEMGHGYGLVHSYDNVNSACGGAPGEYCDPFDVMSALNTYQFNGVNFLPTGGGTEQDGPGLNVPNLLHLGWIPNVHIATYHIGAPEATFTLAALSHPLASGTLALEIVGADPNDIYTVEYRQTDGWDAGLPDNAVFIHEYKKTQSPWSILIRNNAPYSGEWLSGTIYNNLSLGISVSVLNINPGAGTATVKVGFPALFSAKPHIKIVAPPDGSTYSVGQQFNLVATATNFEGETLPDSEVTWQANNQAIGTGKILKTSFSSPGTYTVTATATDQSESDSQSITLHVKQQPTPTPLPKPTVQILSPTPGQNFSSVNYQFSVTLASSASAGVVSYQWSDSLGLISDTNANDTITVTATAQQLACGANNDTITLKVKDSHNQSGSASVKVTFQEICIQ